VIEARNLEAKDANGFSDPYCMLGIIPGNRAHILMDNLHLSGRSSSPTNDDNNTSSEFSNQIGNFNRMQTVSNLNPSRHSTKASSGSGGESSSSGHKTSLIKRFSSFRKSDKYDKQQQQQQQQQQQPQQLTQQQTSHNLSKEGGGANNARSSSQRFNVSQRIVGALRDGKLPAKYIQTTDVKKATLNPVWNERFRLYIYIFFLNVKLDFMYCFIGTYDPKNGHIIQRWLFHRKLRNRP
jgi:hypothetical protein